MEAAMSGARAGQREAGVIAKSVLETSELAGLFPIELEEPTKAEVEADPVQGNHGRRQQSRNGQGRHDYGDAMSEQEDRKPVEHVTPPTMGCPL
jgi:hypothetical protein